MLIGKKKRLKKKMDSLFEVYANIDGVYCHNDRMARGVWASSVLKGRPLKIVGIDACLEKIRASIW